MEGFEQHFEEQAVHGLFDAVALSLQGLAVLQRLLRGAGGQLSGCGRVGPAQVHDPVEVHHGAPLRVPWEQDAHCGLLGPDGVIGLVQRKGLAGETHFLRHQKRVA